MPALNLLNRIIYIENCFGVFRNYLFFKPIQRIFIIIFVCSAILLHVYAFLIYYQIWVLILARSSFQSMNSISFIVYNILFFANSLGAVILSLTNSKSFKTYKNCIRDIQIFCKSDNIYSDAIKELYRRVLIISLTFAFAGLAVTVTLLAQLYHSNNAVKPNVYVPFLIINIFNNYRFITESLTYSVLSEIVATYLQYLSASMFVTAEKLRHDRKKLWGVEEKLKQWWIISLKLFECCIQLSSFFSVQIGTMLLSAIVYYILILYKYVCILTQPQEQSILLSRRTLLIMLTNYVMCTVLIVVSGQRVRSEADKLEATLAAFGNIIANLGGGESVCARSARALSRRLHAAPLRVRLLARPVQMSLLVTVFAITADYTIMLLQFNNVV